MTTYKNIHLGMLCFTGYLAMAGGALLAPVLPAMVGPLQATTQTIGLLMSVFTFSTAIFTLIVGHVIDRADRKTILVPSLVIYGLTGVAGAYCTDFAVLLLIRFIQGIGVAGMMTLAFLIIGDIYKGFESVRAISRMSMSLATGAISAPLIGGGLASLGWNVPFLFYVLSIPFAAIVISMLPETRTATCTTTSAGIKEAVSSLRKFSIVYPISLGFTLFFLLYALIIYVPFLLHSRFGFSSGESGLLLAFEGIAVVLLASRVSSLARRFSLIRVIVAGFSCIGVSMFCISSADSVVVIFLLLILFGAGYGLAQTAIDAEILSVSPPRSIGGILSIHTCMKYMGMSLSPVILAVVLSLSDLHTVFVISGLIGIATAILTIAVMQRFDVLSEPAGSDTV